MWFLNFLMQPAFADELRDIKGLREVSPLGMLMWAGIPLLCVLIVYLFMKYSARKRKIIEDPPISFEILLLEELRLLSREKFSDPELLREKYFKISSIIRLYFEKKFGLGATEMTTDEIRINLESLKNPDENKKIEFLGILESGDRVKFMAVKTSIEEGKTHLNKAISFLESTSSKGNSGNNVQI